MFYVLVTWTYYNEKLSYILFSWQINYCDVVTQFSLLQFKYSHSKMR